MPRPGECHALAEDWRPWRSIAIWYLWKANDTPQKPVITVVEEQAPGLPIPPKRKRSR